MQTFARAVSGAVFEIAQIPDGASITSYFAPGLPGTWAAVPSGIAAAQGWTATESGGVWSFAAPVVAAPTLAQQAAAAIGAGVTLALSGTVTLAATLFPTDPATQAKLAAVVTTVTASGAFPGGASSYPMKDASGAWHSFTTAQYVKVAGAIAAYVAALDLMIDGNPLSATALPPASVAIAV